jgi:hypothetical protein
LRDQLGNDQARRPSVWEKTIAAWFRDRASAFSLDASTIVVEYVWNFGGFPNRSFRVTDGRTTLHLKLAGRERAMRLRRWYRHRATIHADYRGPEVQAEIEGGILPGDGFGLVFPHIAGRPLEASRAPTILPGVVDLLDRLHRDSQLLQHAGHQRTYRDVFISTFVRRLHGDFKVIEESLPNGVTDRLLQRLRDEADRLNDLVLRHTAFSDPADAVTHGDPQWSNILVRATNDWTLIDWDDLDFAGDPILDLAVLFWPARPNRDLWHQYVVRRGAERAPAYERALLLNQIVDSLADRVEALKFPGRRGQAIANAKLRFHREALSEYSLRYEPRLRG